MTAASRAMSAAAFGPGSGVLMSGTTMGVTLGSHALTGEPTTLLTLPARAGGGVLQ